MEGVGTETSHRKMVTGYLTQPATRRGKEIRRFLSIRQTSERYPANSGLDSGLRRTKECEDRFPTVAAQLPKTLSHLFGFAEVAQDSIAQSYGLSSLLDSVDSPPSFLSACRYGTIGKSLPGYKIRPANEGADEVPAIEKRLEARFRGGWVKTGDRSQYRCRET
jgi:hypothetical protein